MRAGALNGQQPRHRTQNAVQAFTLVHGADGSVTTQAVGTPKFITDREGNEYRNANKPELIPVAGGEYMLHMANYRPNGGNPVRYAQVLDKTGTPIPLTNADLTGKAGGKYKIIMQKNNDDCD